jgi:hypothetical protein
LTGRPPYQGTDVPSLLDQARAGQVVPPRQIHPGLPRGLERIVRRALAADPDDRYASAAALGRALRGWLRRRWVAGGLAAGVLVVLAAVALLPRVWTPPPIRVESFQVQHYRGDPPRLLGTIGLLSHRTRFDDNVRVAARLSAPAYCYLLALNPDGSIQVCPKDLERRPPAASAEVTYPSDPLTFFGLTDGTGLQAFVLVASRRPLPAFGAWPHRGVLAWQPSAVGGVWQYDGRRFERLAAADRGQERRVAGATPPALTAVCEALRRLPDVDAVEAIAFPVEPLDAGARSGSPR